MSQNEACAVHLGDHVRYVGRRSRVARRAQGTKRTGPSPRHGRRHFAEHGPSPRSAAALNRALPVQFRRLPIDITPENRTT